MSSVIFKNTNKLRINSVRQSVLGRRRVQNDDIVFSQTGATEDVGLYAICDGVGGHQYGKIAGQLTVGTIIGAITRALLPTTHLTEHVSNTFLRKLIKKSIQNANHEIIDYAAKHLPSGNKMGTTVTLALIYQGKLYVAHVGNGRAYLYRDEQIKQLTQDHSLAAKLVRHGVLNQDDLVKHRHRKTLLRMVGYEEQIEVDLIEQNLESGDKLLLCSDGLWQAYPQPDELAAILGGNQSTSGLCKKLVSTANERDGSDNISAIVVTIEEVTGWRLNFPESMANIWQTMKAYVI